MESENFSIAKRNSAVLDIIKDIEKKKINKSDFICKAIIEKYDRDSNNSDNLKNLIHIVLSEIFKEGDRVSNTIVNSTILESKEDYENKKTQFSNNADINKQDELMDEENEENDDLLRILVSALE